MIKINVSWKGKEELNNLIRYIENTPFVKVEGEVKKLADGAVDNMKSTIDSSRKRPDAGTHHLENSIDWAVILNDPGKHIIIGIANLDKMLKEAPYYEVLNAGGYTPVPNVGYFPGNTPPEQGGGGELWMHTGPSKGSFYMKPTKAIEGIDYFGKAESYISKNLDETVKKLVDNYIKGMGK